MFNLYSFLIVIPYVVIITLVSLIYYLYKRIGDRKFLVSIFVSIFFFIIAFSLIGVYIVFYFYGSLIIIGFICGIVAGLLNEDMFSGLLSGVASIFFGYIGYYLIRGDFFFYVFFLYPLNYYIILSILFGGIGGLLGHQVNSNRKY